MNSSTLYVLFLTLCLILISQFPSPTNARTSGHHRLLGDGFDMINQICKEIQQNKIECTSILIADPETLYATNIIEFSEAILKLGLNNGIKGQKFLKELVKTKYAPAIAECANSNYEGVIRSFGSALSELKEDPRIANYDAKIAGDGLGYCEKALVNARIVNPTISALNHQMSLLSFIASRAINKIIFYGNLRG